MSVIFFVVVAGALLMWCLVPGRRAATGNDDPIEPVDREELEAAEREVRDLGIEQRPEDGFEGDDWGPGAGKRRGGRD